MLEQNPVGVSQTPPLEEKPVAPPTFVASEPAPVFEAPTPEILSLPPSPIKKILPIFLIIAIVLVLAVFAFKLISGRVGKSKVVTLNYWGLWEPEEVVRGVLLEWEKIHPNIKINYSFQSPKEYRERLQSSLARNEGPDVFRFHISWVPMLKNELEPMPSSVMSGSQFESVYYPVVSQNLRLGANVLGVPLMIDTLALYYNEDIFRAAGKDPPTTWDGLRDIACELTTKDESGRIQTAGVALGTVSNVDHWSDILGLMMLQNGADLASPGVCTKSGQEEVCLGPDALTFYNVFATDNACKDGGRVWDGTLLASTMAFATGKVAMYFAPSWRVFDIRAVNPSLNFKIVPVPQLPETNITWATFWVEGVAKKSKYQKEAWEFLKFLSSSETLEKLYAAESNIRLFGELSPRVDMADKLKTNPMVAPFLDQAPKAKTWYLCSNTLDNGLNDTMIKYFEDAVNAVSKGEESKKALETASQGVAQLLSRYGLGGSVAR